MRWLVILGLAGLFVSAPVMADMDTTVHGEVRMRAENVENYHDFDDNNGDDSFSFAPFRVRLGVGVSFGDKVYGYASIQEGDIFGQDDPVKSNGGNLNETIESDAGELILYQGYVKMNEVGGTSLDLKFGRQEYVQGNELLFGDLDFYNGMSHDGVRARWDLELGPLDVVWFRSVEDLFGDDDTDTVGANWMLVDLGMENTELEFYGYYTNSTETVELFFDDDKVELDWFSLGARWSRTDAEDGGFVWSIEVVAQSGDVEVNEEDVDGDINGLAAEGMFGYNWDLDSGSHTLFGTFYYSQGDDDAEDDDLDLFYAPFQDFHRRNGAADVITGQLGNLTSFSIGYQWQGEQHGLRAQAYSFTATEDEDAYATVGSGSGLPGDFTIYGIDGEDDLGTELDVIYTYQVNEYFGFEAGVALFQPGDAIEDWFGTDDDVTRLWGQARLRF
jgi:hypothetical protein